MVESFFDDLSDYTRFLLTLEEAKQATSDFSCVATLKKEGGKYLYMLKWKNGEYIGDYVLPFIANEENLRLFNSGCAELARRLRILIETGDPKQVPETPPAFGILTAEPPDELAPPTEIDRPELSRKYVPVAEDARLTTGAVGNMEMIERYEAETLPPPSGLNLPEFFGYIHYKAYSYLARGPEAYRQQDGLGMPPEDASPDTLAILEKGCRLILEWHGIASERPLKGIGINGFYRLIELFHFDLVVQRATPEKDGTILDKMLIKHVVTGEEMTLYNEVKNNQEGQDVGLAFNI